MIKLNNISKYYHNEGVVTLALHKINLEFELGEFVAITGESGSGKSTLLNVIAGIDSYEEGELYINGEETSYFDDDDWELYRKDKIAFIFQNYNLIDSYTVLKNVEVALVIQGVSKAERIKRAKDIIDKVGLTDHLKHRASKLSGGQKQRLAIARALAKETNIIVADEPTGNLDSESGKQVLELLNKISKDKLVFIVTHNYEQAAPYVSRKIRLFDGEVVEDKHIRDITADKVIEKAEEPTKEITQAATIAKFNIFGQPKKSIFIFLVSFAIVFFIFLFYSFIITSPVTPSYNYSEFNNYQERVIVTKKDRIEMNTDDYNFLVSDNRINKVIKEDKLIDQYLQMNYQKQDYYYYFRGQIQYNIELINNSLIGRMPEKDDEVVLNMYYNDFEKEYIEQLLDQTIPFYINRDFYVEGDNAINLKVVGINKRTVEHNDGYYVNDATFSKIYEDTYHNNMDTLFYMYNASDLVINVQSARILIDNTLTIDQIRFDNLKIDESVSYIKINDKKLDIIATETEYNGPVVLYVSQAFMDQEFPIVYNQYSINLKNVNDRVALEEYLLNNGYYTLSPYFDIKTTDYIDVFDNITSIFSAAGFIFIILILYLIGHLVFKLIMNTKMKDYTILRIIGAKKTIISNIIRFELMISFLVSYIVFFIAYIFLKNYYPFLKELRVLDYIIVFIINILLSLLIARRFIKKQVQKSLYSNLRTE